MNTAAIRSLTPSPMTRVRAGDVKHERYYYGVMSTAKLKSPTVK
jgi:hypothetical protein